MDDILKAIQQLEGRMNERFDQIEQKADQKFNQIDQKFDKIDQKFDRIDEKFDRIDEKFDRIDEKLDRMETTLNAVARTSNDDTVAILKRIDNNTQSITKDIEYLSEQVGKHEMYFHRINEK
ncbi:hypothetical protein [Robertmurraya kyonggiensis]|uniref:t-SNARE coiled-coil homology domain-containing protein n=1 Tax=Robertmurraya kyonggiensis TaxID=1037680 RepID=A0A4U1D491_9BACI|nr:hypothetical protein [Robertmurraya kyonggiensis]TKC16077.1 hypothetical protein FA727_14050 [Robertmurraya kyonggiensis]